MFTLTYILTVYILVLYIKGNRLAHIGARNQRSASSFVKTAFSCEKSMIFHASRNYVHCGIKVKTQFQSKLENIGFGREPC